MATLASIACAVGRRGLPVLTLLLLPVLPARADEGGVSFWLPGTYASLAAVPADPGWSLTLLNYFAYASAGTTISTARQIRIGKLTSTVDVDQNTSLYSNSDVLYVTPGYTFATPVLGGRLSFTVGTLAAVSNETINNAAGASAGSASASAQSMMLNAGDVGFGDVAPQATLTWSHGAHNWMTYVAGGIPVGKYNAADLITFGIGHGALDAGAGYTYLDAGTGHECSAVTGFTYNFVNPSTNYQNGVDWHLDWGCSQYVTDRIHIGAAGYVYQQLSADQGCDPAICPGQSRVIGVGPQIGFSIPGDAADAYVNLRGYGEFDASNRPAGWNVWISLTFTFHSLFHPDGS